MNDSVCLTCAHLSFLDAAHGDGGGGNNHISLEYMKSDYLYGCYGGHWFVVNMDNYILC